MSPLQFGAALLLVLAAGIGLWRSLRNPTLVEWSMLRKASLLALQPIVAALLYLALFPPLQTRGAVPLHVLTGGLAPADLQRRANRDDVVALPEVAAHPGIDRAPDLATALRQRPGARALVVVGDGLRPRDREAAAGRVQRFEAAAQPAGLAALDWPRQVTAGEPIALRGRIVDPGDSARVELLDPAGQVLAEATVDTGGAFALDAVARTPGLLELTLRLRDDADAVRESHAVPLVVAAGDRPRVLLLAGAPGTELKYLRRWLADSGAELHVRTLLTDRVDLRGGQPALDTAALAGMDIVVLEERAWRSLTAAQREALDAAVRGGLGLLLRLTDSPTTADRARLAEWGFAVEPREGGREVRLPGSADSPTRLSRRPLAVDAPDSLALAVDADGAAFARWRPLGQGRLALWWLSDSYRLVLAGESARHGQLWSSALSTLARPRGVDMAFRVEAEARVGERTVICGALGNSRITTPAGESMTLATDPRRPGCAALWPREPGWHRLEAVDADAQWLFVRGENDAPALAAAERIEATRLIAALSTPDGETRATPTPGPRWPWWLAWLAAATLLGALERRREATQTASTSASTSASAS
jgi:hypothetical protein